ncbi:MAG TPA: mechanosensitive ion channel family protein [Steroidobacteraceae bacterium]
MQWVNDLLTMPLFTNSIIDWTIALAIMIGLMIVLLAARAFIRRHHERLAATPERELMELPLHVLSRTTVLFFAVVSVFAGLTTLTVGDPMSRLLRSVLTIAVFLQVGVWASTLATAWLERKRQLTMSTDRAVAGSLGVIGFIARVLIWSIVLLVILENLGVDVTALLAGLGVGGIAVALAVQNILGDLFASLSITFDRPFVVGDFLIVDDYLGTVEYIGLKSTRLRSLSGEQIVMSNADLLSSRVRNYGRMFERRVVFTLNISRETPVELLERIPVLIREAITAQKDTRFDRSHFAKHAPASLDFETVYYVLSPDFNRYMDIQQAINLRLHREFARLGIEFAYPTQTILLSRETRKVQAA